MFTALAVLAVVPAVLLRQDDAAARTTGSKRVVPSAPVPLEPSAQSSDGQDVEPASSARVTTCFSVPLYPLAHRRTQGPDVSLLSAMNRVPAVPFVSRMERFSLGHSDWLGAAGVPEAFAWYAQRMRPVGFEQIPMSVRHEIGTRPSGSVDSPELLYVSRAGAALLQGVRGGQEVRLTLFCGPAELQ